MALCARLCPRSLLGPLGLRCVSIVPCRYKLTLNPKAYEQPKNESHDEKNMRLCRPLSPHLTIYKFQLTSVLSITHRMTGLLLGGYVMLLGGAALYPDATICELITTLSRNYPNILTALKVGLVFPFTYHFFNGIRHLVWDNGQSLTIKGVYSSGYVMLLAAIVSGVALLTL